MKNLSKIIGLCLLTSLSTGCGPEKGVMIRGPVIEEKFEPVNSGFFTEDQYRVLIDDKVYGKKVLRFTHGKGIDNAGWDLLINKGTVLSVCVPERQKDYQSYIVSRDSSISYIYDVTIEK